MGKEIRLQKFLADAGVCSRRKAEPLIKAGEISVNGEVVTELGTKVDPDKDKVYLGKKRITRTKGGTILLLNKPRGYITSTSSKQGKTVYDLIPEQTPRLLPVGRLDKDSEGALLMTNRNELVSALTHPRYQHEKHYQVTVSGKWTPKSLSSLNRPMVIEGLKMSAKVTIMRAGAKDTRRVLSFILTEGKNRQIRRMCESVGLRIHRLVRTEFAGIGIKGLKPGAWRELTKVEQERLTRSTS